MNPPFGTRRKGVDMQFLAYALRCCAGGGAVYSLHKSTTRAYVGRVAEGIGATAELVAQLQYTLPKTYAHQTQSSVEVEVDLLRFCVGAPPGAAPPPLPRYSRKVKRHGGGGKRVAYERQGYVVGGPPPANPAMLGFYQAQGVVPEGAEWAAFEASLGTSLPMVRCGARPSPVKSFGLGQGG